MVRPLGQPRQRGDEEARPVLDGLRGRHDENTIAGRPAARAATLGQVDPRSERELPGPRRHEERPASPHVLSQATPPPVVTPPSNVIGPALHSSSRDGDRDARSRRGARSRLRDHRHPDDRSHVGLEATRVGECPSRSHHSSAISTWLELHPEEPGRIRHHHMRTRADVGPPNGVAKRDPDGRGSESQVGDAHAGRGRVGLGRGTETDGGDDHHPRDRPAEPEAAAWSAQPRPSSRAALRLASALRSASRRSRSTSLKST